jgi:glycosyltransferase involved in cell wall biosynthesis
VSALPEIVVDSETGMLVPPDDPERLAEAIGGLLAEPDQAKAMGEAGHVRLVHDFGVERMVDQTLEVYEQVIASNKKEMGQP